MGKIRAQFVVGLNQKGRGTFATDVRDFKKRNVEKRFEESEGGRDDRLDGPT